MELTERKLKILQAIIGDFIKSAEPVGSRTLSKKLDLGVSPATIRNEMSDLEDMGFLSHKHTSSGRVPSVKAYRLYVNEIMKKQELSSEMKNSISTKLFDNFEELDKTIEHATKILSDITKLTSFSITQNKDEEVLSFINFVQVSENTVILMIVSESGKIENNTLRINSPVSEDSLKILSKSMTYDFKGKTLSEALTTNIIHCFSSDVEAMNRLATNIMPNFINTLEKMLDVNLYMEGLSNVFSIPEFNSDIGKAKTFMDMVTESDNLSQALSERGDGIIITIGDENVCEDMKDCSLITATYEINGKQMGKIGVIGPTRMQYEEVTSVIEYLTDNISNAYKLTGGKDE